MAITILENLPTRTSILKPSEFESVEQCLDAAPGTQAVLDMSDMTEVIAVKWFEAAVTFIESSAEFKIKDIQFYAAPRVSDNFFRYLPDRYQKQLVTSLGHASIEIRVADASKVQADVVVCSLNRFCMFEHPDTEGFRKDRALEKAIRKELISRLLIVGEVAKIDRVFEEGDLNQVVLVTPTSDDPKKLQKLAKKIAATVTDLKLESLAFASLGQNCETLVTFLRTISMYLEVDCNITVCLWTMSEFNRLQKLMQR